jgi:transcriptional regulator with XRE-family HTH domain
MTTSAERLQTLRERTTSGQAREIRKAARLTQSDIARSVGVTFSTLSRWESGERLPRGEAALRYAALLDRLAK